MKAIFIALLLSLLLASCGGDSKPDPTTTPSASPTESTQPSPSATPAQLSDLPDRDLLDLALRFRGLGPDAERLARNSPFGYAVGDREQFYVLDPTTPEIKTISATVRQISDHAYFFVEDGTEYPNQALESIASDFDSVVYPKVTSEFGTEWTPGVDSDPRISLVHARLNGLGGYFSGSDEYPLTIVPRSNAREAVYLDTSVLDSPGPAYNSLVAHELQHLVHWNADPNEDSWVNEGLSEVAAEEASGSGASGGVEAFLLKPDTQLTFWPDLEDSSVHYAASQLFFGYLLDHYGGRERAKELLAKQADSIDGVDDYLAGFGTTFDKVFADWVIANYVDAPSGPYSHDNLNSTTKVVTSISRPGSGDGEVGQFAADYLAIAAGTAPMTFAFDGGDTASNGVPEHDGAYWWSQRGDGIDTKLTREFDLRSVQQATLRFSTWYEIEDGWDYAYVAISTNNGNTWTALPGRETTDYNPVEASYGSGYTGESERWVTDEVDLSSYTGQKILVRFEQVTDDATSFTGFAVDDIEVPEIAFSDDASNPGDWMAEGFTRVADPLEQQFIVQKIERMGENVTITPVMLDAQNWGTVAISGPAVIVVSGATRDTAEAARYHWELLPPSGPGPFN